MFKSTLKVVLTLLASIILIGSLPKTTPAEFHIILDEHFNRDPEQSTWPYGTNGGYSWYHNVYNWPPPFRVRNSICGWGWQDFIYNSIVLQDEDFPGSLWCAYRTQDGPNNPQWPEDDEYLNNMNGWAVWGPFSLRNAISGRVSTWYRVYLDHYAHDSLSISVCYSDDQLYLDGNDFRRFTPIGHTCATTTPDWVRIDVYFDSLYVNRELTSLIGERRCWLAYVWQANNTDIAGMGAFVDDIILGWDDGLFDLRSNRTAYGIPAGEDSLSWSLRNPDMGDTVYFKLDWECAGSMGYTPAFDIQLKIDGNVFFTQHYDSVEGNDSLLRTIATDEPWYAVRGQHTIRWELDTPVEDGGNVEESEEGNNVAERLMEVVWDPDPLFEILTPQNGDNIMIDEPYLVEWTVSDSDSTEQAFTCYLFWSTDTSGWNEDHQVLYNEPPWYMFISGMYGRGEHYQEYTWTQRMLDSGLLEIGDHIYIAGFAEDANPDNITYAIAPGSAEVIPLSAPGEQPLEPGEFKLLSAYPNPFNRSLTIEFNLAAPADVRLLTYDLSGRTVATLIDGYLPAGGRTLVWQPYNLPGGIYLLRLETPSGIRQQKVVYMP
jgi:hypothetical protein